MNLHQAAVVPRARSSGISEFWRRSCILQIATEFNDQSVSRERTSMRAYLPGLVSLAVIIPACISLGADTKKANTPADLNGNDVVSGAELYRMYCAVCHGTGGKGDGPAAAALKYPPQNLTGISRRNGGEFPVFRIEHIIDGYGINAAHRSREMPIWGDYFHDRNRNDALLKLREHNLTQYIKSMQR